MERTSKLTFAALAVAAFWFFVYIVVHEVITSWTVEQWSINRAKLVLDSESRKKFDSEELLSELGEIHAKGAEVFGKCLICHGEDSRKMRFGPPLYEFMGEPVARLHGEPPHGYRNSVVLREMRASDLKWSVAALWAFVHNPEAFAPNTRMPFPGLAPKETDSEKKKKKAYREIKNLIHYITWSCRPNCGRPNYVELDLQRLTKLNWKDLDATVCKTGEGRNYTVNDLKTRPDIFLVPEDMTACPDPQQTVLSVWFSPMSDFYAQIRKSFRANLSEWGLPGVRIMD